MNPPLRKKKSVKMKGFGAIVFLCAAGVLGVQAASVATPTCGGNTASKDIKLVKPSNPPRECAYHIDAHSKYVCQLRIDFAMTLAQPTVQNQGQSGLRTAQCTQDYFQVNGLRLCGVETWQHIYVPFNASAGVSRVDLLIVLANRAGGVSLPNPEWNMVVTQLECPAGSSVRASESQARASSFNDGFLVAPVGCLQYFPSGKGVVKSFNYNDGNGIYPSHLNYAICFRRTATTKSLTIRSYFFRVGAETAASDLLTDSACYRSASSSIENADYLMVPQAQLVDNRQRATYFCGKTNKDVVISSSNPGPLMVVFNSDEIYQSNEAGFAFTYTVE